MDFIELFARAMYKMSKGETIHEDTDDQEDRRRRVIRDVLQEVGEFESHKRTEAEKRAIVHLNDAFADVRKRAANLDDRSLEDIDIKSKVAEAVSVQDKDIESLGKATETVDNAKEVIRATLKQVEGAASNWSGPERALGDKTISIVDGWIGILDRGLRDYAAEIGTGTSSSPIDFRKLREDITNIGTFQSMPTYPTTGLNRVRKWPETQDRGNTKDFTTDMKIAIDNLRDMIKGRINSGGNSTFAEFGNALCTRLNKVSQTISQGDVEASIPLARSIRNALNQAKKVTSISPPERGDVTTWLNRFDATIMDYLDRAPDMSNGSNSI